MRKRWPSGSWITITLVPQCVSTNGLTTSIPSGAVKSAACAEVHLGGQRILDRLLCKKHGGPSRGMAEHARAVAGVEVQREAEALPELDGLTPVVCLDVEVVEPVDRHVVSFRAYSTNAEASTERRNRTQTPMSSVAR